jgi:hypothetical protein
MFIVELAQEAPLRGIKLWEFPLLSDVTKTCVIGHRLTTFTARRAIYSLGSTAQSLAPAASALEG